MSDTKKEKAKYTTWQVTWWSIKFAWKHIPGLTFIYTVLQVVSGFTALLQIGSLASVINIISVDPTNKALILTAIIKLIFFILLPQLLTVLQSYFDTLIRFALIRELTIYEVEQQSALDIATVESSAYQNLLRRAQEWGVFQFYRVLYNQIENLTNIVSVVFAAYILYKIDIRLVLLAVLSAIPSLFVQLKYGREIWGIWDMNAESRRKFFNRRGYFEKKETLVETKLWKIGNKFLSEIKEILYSFDKEIEKTEKKRTWAKVGAAVISVFASGVGLFIVVNLTVTGVILIGTLTYAFGAFRQFSTSISQFITFLTNQIEAARYSSYWLELFALVPVVTNDLNAQKPSWEKPPKIEFKNVSFVYPGTETHALKNLSFTIGSGEKIAIVGLNGAGKTTLIRLLARVYDPTKGEIVIDGIPLKNIALSHWHSVLAILFQDYGTYNFSVKEAIALSRGDEEMNIERVKTATEAGESKEFIEELPKQYDTLLWKGFQDGVELSKGQNQRIALSRMFYRDAFITVLDEPTAAVDALSEEKIFDRLEQLPEDRTVVLISHRYSTVRNADKILVMEHGKIIESGTHTELIKKDGNYAMLFAKQAAGYQEQE